MWLSLICCSTFLKDFNYILRSPLKKETVRFKEERENNEIMVTEHRPGKSPLNEEKTLFFFFFFHSCLPSIRFMTRRRSDCINNTF